ncbi:MAG: hypothetical protein DYG92_02645 [Leptolyngbya sp. PLA1]|nr:hypothetical protein [Leptolyngbya sp. PLA1]
MYLMVLSAGIALTTLGIAGLALVRSQRRAELLRHDAEACRLSTQSALDLAAWQLATDPTGANTWRKDTSATICDTWLGNAQISVLAEDPLDADLSDSPDDPVLLTASARRGAARQMVRARFDTSLANLPCLNAAVWTGGAISFTAATVYADAVVGSNGGVAASTSTIGAGVAGASITGSTYLGQTRVITQTLDMPDATSIDVWSRKGVVIPYASIPGGAITNRVLSAASNPFGATSPSGVYVINCAGNALTIDRSRINATLVIINARSDSKIGASCLIQAPAGQPALLVDGSLMLELRASDLAESTAGNLNPPGTPYLGSSDSDTSDTYPAVIEGLVFVTGNLYVTSNADATVEGVVLVGGSLRVDTRLNVRHRAPETPIEGFRQVVGFALDPNSVERIVD